MFVTHRFDYEQGQNHRRKAYSNRISGMDPITIRLGEDEVDAIDEEAEQRGLSRAGYLRSIIKNRPAVEKTTAETLDDEISELRERIQRIESEIDK